MLLTRPLAQSQRFAAEFAARFGPIETVISPLLQPRFLALVERPVDATAVIFTSETGVQAALAGGLGPSDGLRVAYCVGARTALAAELVGFDTRSAEGDWRDLAAMIAAQHKGGALWFLCAQEAGAQLENSLAGAGINVHRHVIYAQDAQPLTPAARALLAAPAPVILPLFSPRSAQVFAQACGTVAAPLWLAALSPAVADAFCLPMARHVVAHRPNSAALLNAMAPYCENHVSGPPYP